MPNEIDRLMDLDPLELSAQDIDEIIKYQRKMKANFDAGIKSPKGEDKKIDLGALLKASVAQSGAVQPTVTRRR
jgi:hypothetical protein